MLLGGVLDLVAAVAKSTPRPACADDCLLKMLQASDTVAEHQCSQLADFGPALKAVMCTELAAEHLLVETKFGSGLLQGS